MEAREKSRRKTIDILQDLLRRAEDGAVAVKLIGVIEEQERLIKEDGVQPRVLEAPSAR